MRMYIFYATNLIKKLKEIKEANKKEIIGKKNLKADSTKCGEENPLAKLVMVQREREMPIRM